jgi:hypothetical protein
VPQSEQHRDHRCGQRQHVRTPDRRFLPLIADDLADPGRSGRSAARSAVLPYLHSAAAGPRSTSTQKMIYRIPAIASTPDSRLYVLIAGDGFSRSWRPCWRIRHDHEKHVTRLSVLRRTDGVLPLCAPRWQILVEPGTSRPICRFRCEFCLTGTGGSRWISDDAGRTSVGTRPMTSNCGETVARREQETQTSTRSRPTSSHHSCQPAAQVAGQRRDP